MKKFKALLLILLIIISSFSYAKSSVWLAEKEGKKVILAGSIHLLHPSQLPLPAEYLQAFKVSSRIAFEVDLVELDSITVASQMALQFQLHGTTLDKTLRADVWQRLQAVMRKYNIPIQLTRFDAAFMSLSLPVMIWQQQGYQAGIDRILYDKAKAEGKEIVGLETIEQQLAALATLKQINPNVLIEEMLKELENKNLALDILVKQIYAGETTTMLAQINDYSNSISMNKFYQNLLVKRNKAWLSQIEKFADTNKLTLVVVGDMHLIGDESVLNLLAARGYSISYYQVEAN